ncbi:MAG: outer membrane beta-barrel protein [Chitinophagaceae bacterium]
MRNIFLLALTIFILSSANSQTRFGVKIGASVNNRSGYNNDLGPDVKFLATFTGSIFSYISLGDLFSLEPSISYQPKGNRFIGLTFEDQLGNDIGKGNMSYRFDYLQLTIPFQYLVSGNEKIKLFTGLGPYFAYAVGGQLTWKNVSGTPSNEPKKRKMMFGDNGPKRFDAGLTLMLSTQIKRSWVLTISCDAGFVNTNSSGQIESHNISSGLTIGYLLNK